MKKSLLPVEGRDFLLLHASLLLYAVVSIFMKYAGLSMVAQEMQSTLLWTGLAFVSLAIYSVLWQLTLRRMPLSFAYANKAVCTLWIFLLGVVLFGESLTLGKGIGFLVTLLGVCLVVTDHE